MKLTKETRVAIVGGGKMGEAMLAGWLASQHGVLEYWGIENFTVVEPSRERRETLERSYQIEVKDDVSELAQADIVVLAVKPQQMPEVIGPLTSAPLFSGARAIGEDTPATEGAEEPLVISIAAGVSTAKIEERAPFSLRVVRAMPNLPLSVGEGATGLSAGKQAHRNDLEAARELFAALGEAVIVEERLMDAVCALSGSGPAYFCAFLEAEIAAAQKLGLGYEAAYGLALQTFFGTAKLLEQTGETPEALRRAVSSPQGTTLAGLEAFQRAGLADVVEKGLFAAEERSKELSQCL